MRIRIQIPNTGSGYFSKNFLDTKRALNFDSENFILQAHSFAEAAVHAVQWPSSLRYLLPHHRIRQRQDPQALSGTRTVLLQWGTTILTTWSMVNR
jgi:hypothetical protein